MGSADDLVARVAEAYEDELDVLVTQRDLGDDERLVFARWLRPGVSLLDVGCGAGREAFAFAEAGVDVTAIDLSPRLVAVARARAAALGARIEFVAADVSTFTPSRPFDVVYLTPGVYAHIPTRARRVATLAHVTGLLAPGGVVVLAPLLYPPALAISRSRLVDGLRRVLRALGMPGVSEPGDGFHRGCAPQSGPRSFRYLHRFRHVADIVEEVEAAGLVVEDRPSTAPVWVLRPRST
jgi:SAM-dependent methyltransferase